MNWWIINLLEPLIVIDVYNGYLEYKKIEKIADLPYYTEGPAIDTKNNIYFTTLSGKSILKIDIHGKITEWAKSECPNGQVILQGDEHLICDSKLAAIRRFDSSGIFMKDEVKGHCAGFTINVPNDLVVNSSGDIYFTDSIRYKGAVYFIGSNGRQGRLATNLDYPNGLALSADQKSLYVAESYQNRIIKIDLETHQQERNGTNIFATLPRHQSGEVQNNLPDGMTMDHNGNLWVAHHGMQAIQVLSCEGKLLYSVNTLMPLASNLIFIDKKTIIVTGGYGEPGPGVVIKISLYK